MKATIYRCPDCREIKWSFMESAEIECPKCDGYAVREGYTMIKDREDVVDPVVMVEEDD